MMQSGSPFPRAATRICPAAALTIIVALAQLATAAPAAAQPRCAEPVALIQTIDNRVQVLEASTRALLAATRQMPVCAGDTIQVADASRAVIFIVASSTLLALDQNSQLVIAEPASSGAPSFVDLVRGALLFITRVRRSFEVRTPFVNASVEGTEFVVRVADDRALVTVLEGTVRAANAQGELVLNAGQQAVAVKGQAPQLQVIVRPRDAVQWALYYEPVLPADSFEQLASVPDAGRDAAFYVRRAALLLDAGQVDEARADLDQAQKLDPANGDAPAVRAIIEVALNDKEAALQSGRQAVERSPGSTAARLALSYALQANFELEAARDVVAQAVEAQPMDAAAWARLAELRLMLDDVRGAATAAERAVSLAPELGRPHTVLGFTRLAQLKLGDAEAAFEQAISLDSNSPLAHLGLGLTKIRRGRLADGRSDLELAVALNPDSALVRSYLGKAYFDEKREPLAEEQFHLAKVLDERDPTPWLYSAIQKQTLNRPVEAMEDLGASIVRNNNRAVYRSRRLLGGDLAVRGTHLSRVYGDLGFEQLALVEGWKSLDIDPANHAAHRLLADNYLSLPSHQIARDSELLQSQLLQPATISPVQPRLAEHGLNFLEDLGISRVGVNEFTRLFAANGIRVIADGMVGLQDTAGDNVIVSGLFKQVSFSVGQFHFASDGVRENHDVKQDIANLFAQADLTQETTVQFEYRHGDSDQGDRPLLFDPDFFDPEARSLVETSSARVSVRQKLTPSAILLGTYAYRALSSDFTATSLEVASEDDAHFLELRFLNRWSLASVTAGLGWFRGDGVERQIVQSRPFPLQPLSVRHANAYGYSTLNLPAKIALTGGLSIDSLDDAIVGERRQLNPKLGITWAATERTFVRTGVFRVLDRTLISGQTLEPTQVTGFNQFFDDGVGTASWRYGIGVDQQLRGHTYAGIEYSARRLAVPAFSPRSGEVIEGTVEERLSRVYVYSTLGEQLAWSAGYQASRASDPEGSNPWLLERSTTHRVPLELRTVQRNGLFARLRATYFKQAGVFRNSAFELFEGKDQAMVADLSVGYRLPRRWGLIAVDLRNLFDQRFKFQDATPNDPTVVPHRQGFVRLLITF